MALNIFVNGAFRIYGEAAIPSSSGDSPGYKGTIATCTVQGFFLYICGFITGFYYGCFSVYSFVGILNNFEKTKYEWVEKYIHIAVPIYPISMALYIVSIEGFNDSGFGDCSENSAPLECNSDPDIPCERGPQLFDFMIIAWIYLVPVLLILVFPSVIMVILFYKVKQRQDEIFIQAKTVAFQALIYLSPFYLSLLPLLIIFGVPAFGHTIASLYLAIAFPIFSVYNMLVCRYFSFEKNTGSSIAAGHIAQNNNSETQPTERDVTTRSNEFIFSTDEQLVLSSSTTVAATKIPPTRNASRESIRYSFNIFDGTGATGAFAEFINEGDSEDELADNEQTAHWSAVQDHI